MAITMSVSASSICSPPWPASLASPPRTRRAGPVAGAAPAGGRTPSPTTPGRPGATPAPPARLPIIAHGESSLRPVGERLLEGGAVAPDRGGGGAQLAPEPHRLVEGGDGGGVARDPEVRRQR